MVKAMHAAEIEVILDAVYNHTAEGDEKGPTYSYRGIDNDTYYLLQPDRIHYRNDTGAGNTLNCRQPLRPQDDRRQLERLGERNARGRIPL